MNEIQEAYVRARERLDALEAEGMRRMKEAGVFDASVPDWDSIVATQEAIEQEIGLPAAHRAFRQAREDLEQFALAWVVRHGTPKQAEIARRAISSPLTSVTGFEEPFIRACLNLPW